MNLRKSLFLALLIGFPLLTHAQFFVPLDKIQAVFDKAMAEKATLEDRIGRIQQQMNQLQNQLEEKKEQIQQLTDLINRFSTKATEVVTKAPQRINEASEKIGETTKALAEKGAEKLANAQDILDQAFADLPLAVDAVKNYLSQEPGSSEPFGPELPNDCEGSLLKRMFGGTFLGRWLGMADCE